MDMVLEAMGRSPVLKQCELWLVGDGPHKPQLEELVRRHGLEGCVQLPGWMEQKKLGEELGRSQAFVFPSLREFGGGVALEALALGLPAIIVNYGGPAELVTPDCGILLPMVGREELIGRIQQAMEQLAGDPARCRALGKAACEHIRQEFTWEAKAGKIASMYRQMLK
jgi:glycosyltransferase involved in cell wall biosynthesis